MVIDSMIVSEYAFRRPTGVSHASLNAVEQHMHFPNPGRYDGIDYRPTGRSGLKLAQGLLTSKYLGGVPRDARAAKGGSFGENLLSEDNLARARALDEIARRRGHSLAQMAIAWVLRDARVTSALIGARNVVQLDDALTNLSFSAEELKEIDSHATDGGIDLWRGLISHA
jgi:hypothetical protein